MVCKGCGKENETGCSFCGSCGEKLEESKLIGKAKTSLKKCFTGKNLAIASVVAVLLVALAVLIAILIHNPAEKAVKDLYESALTYDYDEVVGLLPPAVVDSLKERLALGESELEIMDSKELTPVYIAEIDEAYQKKFATSKGYIEDAAIVYVEMKWKGEALSRDRISVYVVKIGGVWYFDPLTTFEAFPFEDIPVELPK